MPLSKRTRFEIFKRDGFVCQYCGRRPDDGVTVLEVDHVHPQAMGGTDDEMNLVTSCAECNRGKAAKLLAETFPRPDADLKTLALQQETAELRRYQQALAQKQTALVGVVEVLQLLWEDVSGLTWHPADHILMQFLGRYSPGEVEFCVRDVAPKVASGYIEGRGMWVRYSWSVLRNAREQAEDDDDTTADETVTQVDPYWESGRLP